MGSRSDGMSARVSLGLVAVLLAVAGGCVGTSVDLAPTRDASVRDTVDAAEIIPDGSPAFTPTTTTTALGANNTSASSLFRDEYVPAARFGGSAAPVMNEDNPSSATAAADLAVGAVSKLPIRSLLYPGATTEIFVETQGWFCTNGMNPLASSQNGDQCGSHIDIGYDTNSTQHAQQQIADMRSRGIDGAIMDWSGQSAGKGVTDTKTTSTPAINTGAMFLYKAQAEASSGAFHIAVLEDEGITACAAAPACDVTQQVLSDIGFLNTNFFASPGYLKVGGRPVLFFFALDHTASTYGKTIDWATVRANAAGNPLFVFENAGGYGHDDSDGAYSWINVTSYGSYPGSDPYGTTSFLPYFYGQALAHQQKTTWSSAYKGFDDNLVNGWGGGRRYVGQVCGKTWLDTLALAGTYYSTASQLPGLQLITWDDYEEGSELETGIDNHVVVTASLAGTTVAWSATLAPDAPTECVKTVAAGFDILSTIDHFTVYASKDGINLAVLADNLPTGTASLETSSLLAPGAWTLFVYATAKPSITNRLSNGVAVTR